MNVFVIICVYSILLLSSPWRCFLGRGYGAGAVCAKGQFLPSAAVGKDSLATEFWLNPEQFAFWGI